MESAGDFILPSQQARVDFYILVVWSAAGGRVNLDDPGAQFPERGGFALGGVPRVGGLDGSSKGSALRALKAEGWNAKDVGADLPPDTAFASAACEADFCGSDAQCAESVEAVSESEGDAFHDGACHGGRGHGGGREAVENTGAGQGHSLSARGVNLPKGSLN